MLHLEVLRLLHTEIPMYYCQIGPKKALTPTYLRVRGYIKVKVKAVSKKIHLSCIQKTRTFVMKYLTVTSKCGNNESQPATPKKLAFSWLL